MHRQVAALLSDSHHRSNTLQTARHNRPVKSSTYLRFSPSDDLRNSDPHTYNGDTVPYECTIRGASHTLDHEPDIDVISRSLDTRIVLVRGGLDLAQG